MTAAENEDSEITRTQQFSHVDVDTQAPSEVEEFVIRGELGRGGFGTVYLAFDNTLQRETALKIPHSKLVNDQTADQYLREARAIASLDHPHIIPVYRAASTPEIPCYIVTKLIRGSHLGKWYSRNLPSLSSLIDVLARVADALSYAHARGVVHRDIKPGNILVDDNGHPYVADFGLALRDIDPQGGPTYVGTPSYMSPEQARGEGHRVDGRSDIFSLGVVLYEMVTGRKPFRAGGPKHLLEEVMYSAPEHPRQVNPEIPAELARVILKALSKAVSDRYQTADLLAADLRALQALQALREVDGSAIATTGGARDSALSDTGRALESKTEQPVIPKGLRPFDTRDADFFMQLLPGPRDRDGIPEIIRFWMSRLEPTESDQPVSVGLIYGPSGCGKTSLVRAGIIPKLSPDVTTIYVQASADQTEKQLVRQIVSRVSLQNLPIDDGANLVETFALLRKLGQGRTVIFIDQFEQWLFAHPDCHREPLTQALRQCDGEALQCVLMVRDDFWMGVTRLMQAIDLTIAEDVNVTAVDLFDRRHARNVLAMFGAAYGRLPQSPEQQSPAERRFLDAAVDYLATDGRVICVQLTLLTEMLKNRPWDIAVEAFKDGGAIGMRFFEETFESENSPRRTRIHADGTFRVLRALLPDSGSRIKGAVRSEKDLLEASGYRDKASFRQLLTMLDHELHLITPTDRSEDSFSADSVSSGALSSGFQLTHDFLIAPIRQWVEYHNRSNKSGKARLRLDEFAELYNARPRPQSLPTLSEYLAIRRHTDRSTHTATQRTVMSAAQKHHLRRAAMWLSLAVLLIASSFGVYRGVQRHNASLTTKSAVAGLLDANMAKAVDLSKALRNSPLAIAEASRVVGDTKERSSRRARAALITAESDPAAAQLLADFTVKASVDDVVTVSQAVTFPSEVVDEVANVWRDATQSRGKRIRAACILANGSPPHAIFEDQQQIDRLMRLLLAENPAWIHQWGQGFVPLASQLVPPLATFLSDESRDTESLNAANLLVELAPRESALLANAVLNARPAELVVLSDTLIGVGSDGKTQLETQWTRELAALEPRIDVTRPWGSPWWCMGERRPIADLASTPPVNQGLSDELKGRLADAESVIDLQSIVSHKLPESQFESMHNELKSFGLRVAEVTRYQIEGEPFLAVLWTRDGINSRVAMGLSVDEVREQNQSHLADGFIPASLSVLRDDDESPETYACVWIKPPQESGVINGDLYIDLPGHSHQAEGWGPLGERGLGLPRSNLHVRKIDGSDYFSSVRWETTSFTGYHDKWNLESSQFQKLRKYDRAATLVSGRASLPTSESNQGRTPIWWYDLPIESRSLQYQSRREHLRAAVEAFAEGFCPVSIDAAAVDGESIPRFHSVWWRGHRSADEDVRFGNRLRNVAIALFRQGDELPAVESLQSDFPELRGAMIAAFAQHGLAADWLLAKLEDDQNPDLLRRSCAMALSLYRKKEVPDALQESIPARLSEIYASVGDPGVRSAIEGIATRWETSLRRVDTHDENELTTVANDRMVIVRPDEVVWLGSPAGEPGRDPQKEAMFPVHIKHAFAIATREVTLAQYLEFRPDHAYAKDYAATLDCPTINVSFVDAAKYCRWLSEQEGLAESEMCFPKLDEISTEMKLEDDFMDRIGYRLPTEAEWEFACRGGSPSGRWFGFDPARLNDHAWTAGNSGYRLHGVGRLLPNDYGLFDMLGNTMEHCHTKFVPYPRMPAEVADDPGRAVSSLSDSMRPLNRGGSVLYQPLDARASQRESHGMRTARVYISFRIARTVLNP